MHTIIKWIVVITLLTAGAHVAFHHAGAVPQSTVQLPATQNDDSTSQSDYLGNEANYLSISQGTKQRALRNFANKTPQQENNVYNVMRNANTSMQSHYFVLLAQNQI